MKWRKTYYDAKLQGITQEGLISCALCPRKCKIKEDSFGFCGVRGNKNGRLVTFNYGKGVHLTQEFIETEAVYHFAPGERILSLGNIGCNLNCLYCQNWETSQSKHIKDKYIFKYTPDDIVKKALSRNIRILSWTYNDPVVWHEFVIDTAKLAKKAGLFNLYKSAFFITEEAVRDLLPFIDIFSISIKAISLDYYQKLTSGRMQPVLDAVKQVFMAGKQVEISNLMVTDISDDEDSARKMAEWVLTNTGPQTPLHFVRFHPAYKMNNTVRTPIFRLIQSRKIALDMGIEHVYLGNIYDSSFTSTFCVDCGSILVKRFGLNSEITGLTDEGGCKNCGRDAHFRLITKKSTDFIIAELPSAEDFVSYLFDWKNDFSSLHVEVFNPCEETCNLYHRHRISGSAEKNWRIIYIEPDESYRFIMSKMNEKDIGIEIAFPRFMKSKIYKILDRAYYPTTAMEVLI